MKTAIASMGKNKTDEISMRSGRAPYFLIFEDGKLVETIKNPFAVGGGGAGFGVAKMLADKDVDLIVAGQFGDNMVGALEEKGIAYRELSGQTVEKALAAVSKDA